MSLPVILVDIKYADEKGKFCLADALKQANDTLLALSKD